MLVITLAVAAAAVLLMQGRADDGGGDPAAAGPATVPATPAQPQSVTPAGAGRTAAEAPVDAAGVTPAPPESTRATQTAAAVPPHDTGGVTGTEELAPAAAERAVRVAEQFARQWSDPEPGWHARLGALATPALATALAAADPVHPPPEATGEGTVLFGAPEWARVRVPGAGGSLVLDLTMSGDGWLVSAVDWRPG